MLYGMDIPIMRDSILEWHRIKDIKIAARKHFNNIVGACIEKDMTAYTSHSHQMRLFLFTLERITIEGLEHQFIPYRSDEREEKNPFIAAINRHIKIHKEYRPIGFGTRNIKKR